MSHNNIYILAAVSAKERTESDIELEYNIAKLKYNISDSLDEYRDRISRYDIDSFTAAYFNDLDEAVESAKSNPGDINEGGCNNYLVAYSRPLKYIYPEVAEPITVLMEYSPKNDSYIVIDEDEYEDIHKKIISRFNIFYGR